MKRPRASDQSRARAGHHERRAKTKYVTLVRDAAQLAVRAGDLGTEERKQHGGGIVERPRRRAREEGGGMVRGAFAVEPGPFESQVALGRFGRGDELGARLEAADELRRAAIRAGLTYRVTANLDPGRSGPTVSADPSSEEAETILKREAREERAHQRLARWAELAGTAELHLALELIVWDREIRTARIGEVVQVLDRIAQEMRIRAAQPRHARRKNTSKG